MFQSRPMNTTLNNLQDHAWYDCGFGKNLIQHKTRKRNASFRECNFSEGINFATYDTYDSSLMGIRELIAGSVV